MLGFKRVVKWHGAWIHKIWSFVVQSYELKDWKKNGDGTSNFLQSIFCFLLLMTLNATIKGPEFCSVYKEFYELCFSVWMFKI